MLDIDAYDIIKIKTVELVYSNLESINIPIEFIKRFKILEIEEEKPSVMRKKDFNHLIAHSFFLKINHSINNCVLETNTEVPCQSLTDKIREHSDLVSFRLLYENGEYTTVELINDYDNKTNNVRILSKLDEKMDLTIEPMAKTI